MSLDGKRLNSDKRGCRGTQLMWGRRSPSGGKNGGSDGGLKCLECWILVNGDAENEMKEKKLKGMSCLLVILNGKDTCF